MKEKEEYAKLIKDFNEINVKSICEELGINHKNVYSGKTSLSNLLKKAKEAYYPFLNNMDGGMLTSAAFRANESFKRWYRS